MDKKQEVKETLKKKAEEVKNKEVAYNYEGLTKRSKGEVIK